MTDICCSCMQNGVTVISLDSAGCCMTCGKTVVRSYERDRLKELESKLAEAHAKLWSIRQIVNDTD